MIPILITPVVASLMDNLLDKWHDIFSNLEYREGIITPLKFYEEDLPPSIVKKCAEDFGKEILDYGCVLNSYVQNNKKRPVSISETAIIVDNYQKMIMSKIYIIGMYSEMNDEFFLYAINNGSKNINNSEVEINIKYYNEEKKKMDDLDKNELESFLNGSNIIKIEDLSIGEIRKIATYKLNNVLLQEKGAFTIYYDVAYKEKNRIEHFKQGIGIICDVDSKIKFSLLDEFGGEEMIERSVIIEDNIGSIYNIPANFIVGENNLKNVLYSIYPISSCELTFHAKFKCAGEDKEIETEQFVQKIYVPLYKEEYGFFYTVREFIEKYNIDSYYYNSNPVIQKEIIYSPIAND